MSGPPERFGMTSGGVEWTFTDNGLAANTAYVYQLRAFMPSGAFVRSDNLVARTTENIPSNVPLPSLQVLSSTEATASWPLVVVSTAFS